jgi:antitoxin (DNA-binding transcriptional repressor) of toxin-antitoxin stability system
LGKKVWATLALPFYVAHPSQAFERRSVDNTDMGNRVIRISDAEAASDFTSLLDRVRAGDEVVIEHDARPVAVLRPAAPAQSIDKVFAAIAADVPDEDWARVPTDLSKNRDHYLWAGLTGARD